MSATENKTEIPSVGDFVKFRTPYVKWIDDDKPGPFSYGVVKSIQYQLEEGVIVGSTPSGHAKIINTDGIIIRQRFDNITILAKAKNL